MGPLLLLHLMAGIGVAVAIYVTTPHGKALQQGFVVLTAVLFWPLYVPILLAARSGPSWNEAEKQGRTPAAPPDELAQAIAQADAELDSAMQSLDGWAEHVLAREKGRLQELRQAWIAQADRIRAMDRLLARPEYAGSRSLEPNLVINGDLAPRLRLSQETIRQNLDRLKHIRQRTLEDLLITLAWVRELASMIHLAKFSGAPATRAEELVGQIAAAVEGLSALTWQEESAAAIQENHDEKPAHDESSDRSNRATQVAGR